MGKRWFEFPYASENLLSSKLLFPDIAPEPRATFDKNGETLILNTAYGAVLNDDLELDLRYVCALFNSSPLRFMFKTLSPVLSGGYYRFQTQYVGQLPINQIEFDLSDEERKAQAAELISGNEEITEENPEVGGYEDEILHRALAELTEQYMSCFTKHDSLNLSLLDYIQPYADGSTLTNVATYQPPQGVGDTKLILTKEDYENLRIGTVSTERESDDTVLIHATARYKPEDEDAYETDRWGYAETEPIPAMRLTDLTDTEAALVEAFVPVAADEAGGFANFRETATKTNSLVDRLEALTLPDPADVEDGVERYVEAKERAAELDAEIERTDDLIDEIVYELYGLSDEEIAIVEEAVTE